MANTKMLFLGAEGTGTENNELECYCNVNDDIYITILDCKRFVENHLGNVKANEGKIRFKPYLDRLLILKSILNGN